MSAAVSGQMKPRAATVFSQPSDRENAVTRVFHAPIDRVFRVFTDPVYAPSVFAENPADATIEEMDVRPGGRFSIVVRGRDGSTTRFFGEYREVIPLRRVVNTFNVSALPGVLALETDEFEAAGEDTRLTVRWKFDSREDRDKMYGPEFEAAVTKGWDLVDRVLESMP